MFFNKYPYTDCHELNLDWILGEIRRLYHEMSDFEAANHIKPCGVWDITKQYEAWSVVTDGGAGYISTRPVPAGIAISNQDYWTEIVDYDAFWGTLNLRVQALENSMTTLTGTTIPAIQNDVSGLDGRLDTLEGTTIPGLDGRLDTLEDTTIPGLDSRIDVLEEDLDRIKNRKFIFIADSYAGTSQFVERVNGALHLTAGVNSFCNAVGGEGFTEGTDGNGYLHELQQHAGSMTAAVRNSITDIMVLGGANDAKTNQSYSVNSIENHAIDFINYARTNFPNAKISFGFLGFCKFNSSVLENRYQANLELMAYYYKDTALKNGCAYISNIEFTTRWLIQNCSNADGLHPNFNGGIIIGEALVNYILGAPVDVSVYRYPCEPSGIIGGATAPAMLVNMNNAMSHIYVGQITLTGYSGTIAGGTRGDPIWTHLFDYQRIFVNRPIYMDWYMYHSGGSNNVIPIVIRFLGTECTIIAMNADSSGWRDVVMSNETFIIPEFEFVFDSIYLA